MVRAIASEGCTQSYGLRCFGACIQKDGEYLAKGKAEGVLHFVSKRYKTTGTARLSGFAHNSVVEHLPSKQSVMGSKPITHFKNAKTVPVRVERGLMPGLREPGAPKPARQRSLVEEALK